MSDKKLVVLVGPSGSGKTSIGEVLSARGILRLVTTTTREPREGEMDGVDYYFKQFSSIDTDEFVEQTLYNGNRYGLTVAEVTKKFNESDVVHVSLDKSGAEAVRETYPKEAYVVFIAVTEEEMIRRMKNRGDSDTEIQERVAYCRQTNELAAPDYADLEIINEDIEKSAQAIIDHIL